MRIDLHCHSKWSKRPTLWVMQKINCPESYTDPAELYRIMMERGMDAVTITDHNAIDACLEIAHLPNTFISEEVTVYFPEDRCKVHILTYDITERQHVELMRVRENIYEFVDYCQAERIKHVCAHPLFGVNDRLTLEHVEKLILLFKNFEVNGDQNPVANDYLLKLCEILDEEAIDFLANKHGVAPRGEVMWQKNFTAGSDDHGSLHLGKTYTQVIGAKRIEQFWSGVVEGRATIHGQHGTPRMLAQNVYAIGYQFYMDKFGLGPHTNRDLLLKFLDRALTHRTSDAESFLDRLTLRLRQHPWSKSRRGIPNALGEIFRAEAHAMIESDPRLMSVVTTSRANRKAGGEDLWFEFVERLSSKILTDFGMRTLDRIAHARIFDLFHSIGSAGSLYAMLAPYFVAYGLHRKSIRFSQEVYNAFAERRSMLPEARTPRVAHFTDTFGDVNGVALTLQQQARAAHRMGKAYQIITCNASTLSDLPTVAFFEPVGTCTMPEYEGITVAFPPFLKILDYCFEHEITHVHASTPGPMGLAALAVARILNLPISGTYHTSIPQYAKMLTEDGYVEELMWKAMLWFYDQMDSVYTPSVATADELIERGLARTKVRTYPRGVDTHRFRPAATERERGEEVRFLYAGRVSKEKNLDVLVDAFLQLAARLPECHLTIAGDGPYCGEMKARLKHARCHFTGFLQGEALTDVYRQCDVFVFPSTTDTFGNVVLEAQACGLPVIVTDAGGPKENLVAGTTGVIVPGNDVAALSEAMFAIVRDRIRLDAMRRAARTYAESRSFDNAFLRTWRMYTEVAGPVERAPIIRGSLFEEVLAS